MKPQDVLINAINDLYVHWKSTNKKFLGEKWRNYYLREGKKRDDYLDSAFADELRERLSFDSGWKIRQEVNLQGLSKVWCKYDIGCYYDNKLIGLFELSVSDTNVAHALHNGEVKLLGICDGISVHEEEQSLKTYKKLGDNDINYAQKILSNIPVRGLVFIAGKNPPVETEAKWYLTEKNK